MERSCNYIIKKLLENQIISEQDKELYLYGLRAFELIGLNIFTALLIGYFTHRLPEVIIFFIFFIPLRSYAGGYHTKNKFTCYCCSSLLLLFVIFLPDFILSKAMLWVTEILFILSVLLIYFLSPLPNYNRSFDKAEHTIFKKRARYILLSELLIITLSFFTHSIHWVIIQMSSPITAALLLVLNLLSNKISKRKCCTIV